MSTAEPEKLVSVSNLSVHFPIHASGVVKRQIGVVKAVDGVTFDVFKGETLGMVGESGCGKSTTGLATLRLIEATGGSIHFEGRDISKLSRGKLRPIRQRMQMVYQDPYSSLNPRMKVRDIIGEPLTVHHLAGSKAEYRQRTDELLEIVGLHSYMGDRYPHEFSGGQRQRIGIARALAVNPSFIICDEPVSALDVSIQAQIINLMEDLQQEFGLSYLFVAHDLAVVQHISTRVAVMYLGKIVEIASRRDLYRNPSHPYTQALLEAVPVANPALEAERAHRIIEGEVPSPINPPSGCSFHPRCPMARAECKTVTPELKEIDSGHSVACHLFGG
ncbi:MAG: ATP-binding cassette domain-containing protein [Betaproteobacteria bacterium]|nr:MAG: ATP-binding cassette domain-containing protein [Betaproteobacteria bacterium]